MAEEKVSRSDDARVRRKQTNPAADDHGHDFLQLISGYYREEMRRALTWRQRLDRTTNWAVVITATLLTWVFPDRTHPHYVVLIGMVAIIFFVFVEAHRYRVYDMWRAGSA